MSYTALYRVWRPGRFSEVVGQNHISNTLKNAVVKDRVSHAYLFAGPRGTGKTSLAKIMAKAVNCFAPEQGEPCNQCENCLSINNGSFMDYFEIDAASNRGIDEIRDMREKVKFSPSQGKIKVYVIDEVHMLTNEAFNALLKTLEEPPAHVMFILATTEPQKIPLTILSRCQRYDFKKIHETGIEERLAEIIEKEEITVDKEALSLIIKKAEGGMRDAISILDQAISAAESKEIRLFDIEEVLGTLNDEQLYLIFSETFSGNIEKMISTLDAALAEGRDIKQIIKDMIDYVRDIVLYKASGVKNDFPQTDEKLVQLAELRSLEAFNRLLMELINAEQKMYYFSRPRILLETTLIGFAGGYDAVTASTVTTTETAAKADTAAKEKPVQKSMPETKEAEKMAASQASPEKEPGIAAETTSKQNPDTQTLWQEVLQQIKKEKITLHACLVAGEFQLCDGQGQVIFEANKKFHQERVASQENIEYIETIFEKKLKQTIRIQSVLAGSEPDKKNSGETPDNKTEESNEEFDVVGEAMKIFSSSIVESKDS